MIKKIKIGGLYFWSFLLLMLFNINNVYAADCNGVFGDPKDSNSIANLIVMFLNIFRIAAPVLVIVFGSVDLFMAMVSSSEDKMKKAQNKFMQRLMLGVCLFFVPTVLELVLDVASKQLGYDACMFDWLR